MRSILCFNAMQFFTYHLRRKREIKNTFETVLCTNHDQKVLKWWRCSSMSLQLCNSIIHSSKSCVWLVKQLYAHRSCSLILTNIIPRLRNRPSHSTGLREASYVAVVIDSLHPAGTGNIAVSRQRMRRPHTVTLIGSVCVCLWLQVYGESDWCGPPGTFYLPLSAALGAPRHSVTRHRRRSLRRNWFICRGCGHCNRWQHQ